MVLLKQLYKVYPDWIPASLKMTIKPIMINATFKIGYKISIKKTLYFFETTSTEFFSYKLRINPAITIKKLLTTQDFEKIPVQIISLSLKMNKKWFTVKERIVSEITLSQYINESPKEGKNYKKEKHTTLLVFRTGSVILSGIHENIIEESFYLFQKIFTEYKYLLQ